jgi:hypothetical protein
MSDYSHMQGVIVDNQTALIDWCLTPKYNVNMGAQLACKILYRMKKPVTAGEWLNINPNTYRGLYGVGEKMNEKLLEFTKHLTTAMDKEMQ